MMLPSQSVDPSRFFAKKREIPLAPMVNRKSLEWSRLS